MRAHEAIVVLSLSSVVLGGCALDSAALPPSSTGMDAGADTAAGDGGDVGVDVALDVGADVALDTTADAEMPFVPVYTLTPGADTCPDGWEYAGFADGCLELRSGCGAEQSSLILDPPVSPWQEIRGYVRGLQGQTPDAFARDPTSLDDVYVDGISITTAETPRRHLWTFAAGLYKATSRGCGNCCPCDNGRAAPDLVGDNWTCETGNDSADWMNGAPIYLTDVLWDADGDAHGPGCTPVAEPGWFEVRLDEPTTAQIEVRIMADSCDDKVSLTALELEVR